MTNKQLQRIMVHLGMVEPKDTIGNDLKSIVDFVETLTLYNDIDTINKLLVVILCTNESEPEQE